MEPIIKFRRYKVFEHAAIREFHSRLIEAMIGARGVQMLPKLVNEQMLPSIMGRMPIMGLEAVGQGEAPMGPGERERSLLEIY
jgi:hypothetical protein